MLNFIILQELSSDEEKQFSSQHHFTKATKKILLPNRIVFQHMGKIRLGSNRY